jgi:cytochrome P450
MSVYLGPKLAVVVDDFKTVKSMLAESGDTFAARPEEPGALILNEETRKALFAVNGTFWKEHRRFALSTLRDFGMGRSALEPAMLNEIQLFVQEMHKEGGKPIDIGQLLGLSICNNISLLEFGKRFDYTDPAILNMKKHVDDIARFSTLTALFGLFGEWVMKIPFLSHFDNSVKIRDANEGVLKPMWKMVAERKKIHVEGNYNDYLDAYLNERIQRERTKNYPEFFDDISLVGNLHLFLGAGTETTTTSIRALLLRMLMHPDVQRKVQQEIDDVIGRDRLPSMDDRSRMPYTDATIQESMRVGTPVPINAPHSCLEDATLGGYTIPKGTTLFANTWAIHHDETLFPDPHSFRPERFINAEGKFVKHEAVIPFSIGKRYCPGEPLARMEVFLYFTSILQKFNLINPDNQVLTTEVFTSIVDAPKPYLMRLLPRGE